MLACALRNETIDDALDLAPKCVKSRRAAPPKPMHSIENYCLDMHLWLPYYEGFQMEIAAALRRILHTEPHVVGLWIIWNEESPKGTATNAAGARGWYMTICA